MKYESHITQSVCSAQSIYRVLSNLKNFERVRDRIPQDKIQELEIEEDYVRVKVNGLGQKLGIFIADKEGNLVFKSEGYRIGTSELIYKTLTQIK